MGRSARPVALIDWQFPTAPPTWEQIGVAAMLDAAQSLRRIADDTAAARSEIAGIRAQIDTLGRDGIHLAIREAARTARAHEKRRRAAKKGARTRRRRQAP